MPRGPGRDGKIATQRQLRLLTRLAQAMPQWVNRDELAAELFPGAKAPRDAIARDKRALLAVGWNLEQRGEGADMAWRLVAGDPRLRTTLSDEQLRELARAARVSGFDPATLGLPATSSTGADAGAPIDGALREAIHLEEILHARRYRCVVTLTYKDRRRELQLDDVRRTSTGRWRNIAREDGLQKQFRLDRCDDVRVGPPGSASEAQPAVQDMDPLTISDGEPVDAEVLVAPEHEGRIIRELGSAVTRLEGSDGILLTIPVTNRWLWRMRLYQLGTRVRLLGPPQLCDEVRTELLTFAREDQ